MSKRCWFTKIISKESTEWIKIVVGESKNITIGFWIAISKIAIIQKWKWISRLTV